MIKKMTDAQKAWQRVNEVANTTPFNLEEFERWIKRAFIAELDEQFYDEVAGDINVRDAQNIINDRGN